MTQRLQKAMAAAGIGSRRTCEEYIRQGRVTVNGETAELGCKVDVLKDEIRLDHELVHEIERPIYIVLHKPVDVLSSLQSQGGHPTVESLVDVPERVYPAGRLDLDSEGLILLTNDGELTHRLTHPRFEHEKEYRVRLDRPLEAEDLAAWRSGLAVADLGKTAPVEIQPEESDKRWVRIVMHEGKKRQIRKIAKHLGYQVERLIRVRMETLTLGDLPAGTWRQLTQEEVVTLRKRVGLPKPSGSREKM